MSLDWEASFALAEQLSQPDTGPGSVDSRARDARLRCAIGRAYYAAFWCSRDYWRRTQPEHPLPLDGTVHYEVRGRFERYSEPECQRIAQNLRRLLDARRHADYEDKVANLPALTVAALGWATRILNAVGGLDS